MAKTAKQLILKGEEVYPKTLASGVDCGGETLEDVLARLNISETALVNTLRGHFLSKEGADAAVGPITINNGLTVDGGVSADDIAASDSLSLGDDVVLMKNSRGESVLNVDRLNVAVRALFKELTIEKESHVGGAIIVSPASGKAKAVAVQGNTIKITLDLGEYNSSTGAFEKENLFKLGDFVRCQSWGSTQRFWWRGVVGVGTDYILVSNDSDNYEQGVAEDSDIPAVGDEFAVVGNDADVDRQNVIIIDSFGDDAPSVTQYSGVSTMALASSRIVTRLSPSGNIIKGANIMLDAEHKLTLSAATAEASNDFVVKRLLTAQDGARVEVAGTELKVYGNNGVANIVFGTDDAGNAVLKYVDANGNVISVFDQRGTTSSVDQPERVTASMDFFVVTDCNNFSELYDKVYIEDGGRYNGLITDSNPTPTPTYLYTAARSNGDITAGNMRTVQAAQDADGRYHETWNQSSSPVVASPISGIYMYCGSPMAYNEGVEPNDGQEGYEGFEHKYPDSIDWGQRIVFRCAFWFDDGKVIKKAKFYINPM